MNQLFLVVSIILLLFSLFISSQVKEGFTQCGGDSNYTKTDVSLSFFPEYFAQLFLSPPTSSITNNANSYQLGCAQIPSKRFIPIDALIFSFIFFALFVIPKIKFSKFIYLLKKLKPTHPLANQPQNQQNDANPKEGLSIMLSFPYFIYTAIPLLLFLSTINGIGPTKGFMQMVLIMAAITIFLSAFGILLKKSWAGLIGLIVNILLICSSVYGIIYSLWIVNYEAQHPSSNTEGPWGWLYFIFFIIVGLIILFITILTTRSLWRLAFSIRRSSSITNQSQPNPTSDPRFPTLDAQPKPQNSPPENKNQN